MANSDHKYHKQLEQIHDQIFNLTIDEGFKKIIIEDIELATMCLQHNNILGVINALAVVVAKLQTCLHKAPDLCCEIEPLLVSIHHFQQILIRIPIVTVGPPGPMGATGPIGPIGCTGPTGSVGATGPGGSTTFVSTCTLPMVPIKKCECRPKYTFICRTDNSHQHR